MTTRWRTAKSRWREPAARVIRETLRKLPANTPLEQKRKAISAAYPFGERAMHPYKIWLSEVKRALGQEKKKSVKPRAYFDVADSPLGKFWIWVRCDWCCEGRAQTGIGCIVCGRLVNELRELLADNEFLALLRIARERKHPGPLSDWLGDKGHCELAALFFELFQGAA